MSLVSNKRYVWQLDYVIYFQVHTEALYPLTLGLLECRWRAVSKYCIPTAKTWLSFGIPKSLAPIIVLIGTRTQIYTSSLNDWCGKEIFLFFFGHVWVIRRYSKHSPSISLKGMYIKTLVLFMGVLALSFMWPLRAIKWELHDLPSAEIGNVAVNTSCCLGRLGQGEASAFPGAAK